MTDRWNAGSRTFQAVKHPSFLVSSLGHSIRIPVRDSKGLGLDDDYDGLRSTWDYSRVYNVGEWIHLDARHRQILKENRDVQLRGKEKETGSDGLQKATDE